MLRDTLNHRRVVRGIGRTPSRSESGMTLLELIIACAILMVLSSAALPIAKYTIIRQKEAELRRDLREMKDAIDRYKDAADRNQIRVEVGSEGYPPDLETLAQTGRSGVYAHRVDDRHYDHSHFDWDGGGTVRQVGAEGQRGRTEK